jgi:hypothetical protein
VLIAVDFDGTCVTNEYPNIGKSIGAEHVLQDLVKSGHELILWTMRCDHRLQEAVNWFMLNDIELFGVNENPEQHTWTSSSKAHANFYIDDLALGAPLVHGKHRKPYIDWPAMREILIERKILRRY